MNAILLSVAVNLMWGLAVWRFYIVGYRRGYRKAIYACIAATKPIPVRGITNDDHR